MPADVDFRALFELSPNAYTLLDRELRFVAANSAYLQATGVPSLDTLLGKTVFEVFPGDGADASDSSARVLRESLARVMATGKPDTLALIPYNIGGERMWSATHTPIFDEKGTVRFVLQHTVDVTALRKDPPLALAQQLQAGVLERAQRVQETNFSLEAERNYLRRLFELAPAFIAVTRGPNHVFELANGAYEQLVAYRPVVGKSVREALPELKGQGFYELLDRVYSTGEPYVGRGAEVLLSPKPGAPAEPRYLDFVYQPVMDAQGAVAGIFVQGQDVTAARRAEQELARHREQLEELVRERTAALAVSEAERSQTEAALRQAQKMEAVGNLTGGVAHDFNNLLQVIGGNLQLLQDTVRDPVGEKRLQTALSAVARGAKLASHLLAFGRRQPLDPRAVDLGKLALRLDDLLRRTLGDQIELATQIEPGLWNTFADPNQLENVILNLAINARDAISGPGRLIIELRNATLDSHYAQLHSEASPGEFVMLAISDDGCGMPPEVMERAFEPFYTTKPEGRGTGLGLSMVYGFVRQSGGHLTLESEVGSGTTIRIYLPRTLESEQEPSDPVDTLSERGTERVLVVEDDPAVLATVSEMLRGLGYQVLSAADAAAALGLLRRGERVDLLFTDVMMPGALRGPDLAREARALSPSLEVLFTSGYPEDAIVHGGRLDAGVQLLSKPYSREELARRLRKLLHSRASTVRASASMPTFSANTAAGSVVSGDGETLAMSTSQDGPPPRGGSKPAETRVGTATLVGPMKILVVEDDEDIRLATQELLEVLGHQPAGAESAEQARGYLTSQQYDLLITDVGLPGTSGLELATEALRAQPSLRVILATGRSRDDVKGSVQGAVVLPKPYDLAELERALERARAPR